VVKIIVDKQMLNQKIVGIKDGDLIELAIIPSQIDDGNHVPAFLHLAAIHTQGIYEDLENIDETIVRFN
jgi:hypothetical protein